MSEMIIDFPATDDVQNAKMKNLIKDLEDCLETTISIESVSLLRVKYDGSRAEVDAILKRLAGNKTGLRSKAKTRKQTIIKPFNISYQKIDKRLDPLGS